MQPRHPEIVVSNKNSNAMNNPLSIRNATPNTIIAKINKNIAPITSNIIFKFFIYYKFGNLIFNNHILKIEYYLKNSINYNIKFVFVSVLSNSSASRSTSDIVPHFAQ